MQVKDYLTEQYRNKCFLLKMKNGEVRWTQIAQDLPDEPFVFYADYSWDANIIEVDDIDYVIQEVHEDLDNGCDYCNDGVVDWEWRVVNPHEQAICDKCKVKHKELEKYYTNTPSIYKYNSKEELVELLRLLDSPIITTESSLNTYGWGPNLAKLNKSYGLVYTYSTWHDYDDDPTQWCGIIDGAVIQE